MIDFINKIPNTLRYIISIPVSLIGVVLLYFIISLGNLLFSDPNSIWYLFTNFIIVNGLNVIIFFWIFNIILPKYRFKITLALSILLGIVICVIQGISIATNTLTTEYIIGCTITIISLIISCILSYKEVFIYKD